MKRLLILLTIFSLLHSCVSNSGGGKARSTETNLEGPIGTNPGIIEDGAGPGDSSLSNSTDDLINGTKVDLRHLVDPYDGTYRTKVTIPSNYEGLLYISGLNISSLKSEFIYVRFKFGKQATTKEIKAIPGTASGITPQTNVDVLILDLKDKPFKDIVLNYDLFDYNDYDTNDDGIEFGAGDDFTEPTNDIRSAGLYCRGLNLEDDPTFTLNTSNSACDAAGETCLYTYASIQDSALYDNTANAFINPTSPQVDLENTGYVGQTQAQLTSSCLPDVNYRPILETLLQTTTASVSATSVAYGDTAFAGTYTYYGPYRRNAFASWQVTGDALYSNISVPGTKPTGLFQYLLPSAPVDTVGDPSARAQAGVKSFLFPRAAKTTLNAGVQYVGLTDLSSPFNADRSVRTQISSGDTEYVDGCNIRVSNPDYGSCNVTGTIELLVRDQDTGGFITISTSNKIKLQLSRPSDTDIFGNEVLYTALRQCTNSNACGSNECCFNRRCWSRDIVSQCIEEVTTIGNLATGQTCNSDFQCATLCCATGTQTCSVHNPDDGYNCNKNAGEACITKEFCKVEFVTTYILIKNGVLNGKQQCSLVPYQVPTNGDCINGTCNSPTAPTIPTFDPANPDCSTAVDAPLSF